MRQAVAVVVALALPGAAPAAAQMNPASIGLGLVMSSAINAQTHQARRGRSTAHGRRAVPAAPRPVVPLAALRFRIDPAVRQHDLDAFLTRISQKSPVDGRTLETFFSQQDGFGKMATWMDRYGLDQANLADCITVYLSSAWQAAHATNADPSRAQLQGLRAQVTLALRSTPLIKAAPETLKQDMADANLLQAALTDGLGGHAQSDPAVRGTVRDGVAQAVRQVYSIDILSVRYTEDGFVPG